MATGYVVTPNVKGTAKGELVEVPGLGLLKNGSANEIDPDQADYFRQHHGRWAELEGGKTVWEQGPTVLQHFENTQWMEVSTPNEPKKSGDSK
jgi:hypothetical protein